MFLVKASLKQSTYYNIEPLHIVSLNVIAISICSEKELRL